MRHSVAFVLPDLGGGGAQRVMLELANGLDPHRFDVTLVVLGNGGPMANRVPAGIRVISLGADRLLRGMPRLVRCLRSLQPAIVVSVMGYLNLAVLAIRPLLKGSPRMIVREANIVSATLGHLPSWVPARLLYRVLYPRSNAIIVPVFGIAAEIANAAPAAEKKIVVLRNPINEASLRQRAVPQKRPPGGGLVLVGAGRLTPQKGFDRLIDIMPRLPADTRLTIYGDGADRGMLERKVVELELSDRVKLEHFTPDLPAAMAGADVFVLPSRWEGLPNVALEALAVGTPVVASSEAGLGEVVQSVPVGSVTIAAVDDAFVTAIRRVMPQPVPSLRPSLLPAEYRLAAVRHRFEGLLLRVAKTAPDGT